MLADGQTHRAVPLSGVVLRGPLSEQVLRVLPRPAGLWFAVWALIPWINAAANLILGTDDRTSAIWEQSTLLIVLNYAALSFASGFTLWATGHLTRRVDALRSDSSRATDLDDPRPFRGMDGIAGPLVASCGTALVFAVSAVAHDGTAPGLVRGATWLLIGIPIWSFLWAYAALLVGLGRLGRERLVQDSLHVDPGFGVQPLGRIASTGLWMLLVWLVPVVLTGLPDTAGVVIGLLVLVAALATFFLALYGLHRQMVEAKARELAIARALYAKAYEPVRTAPTLESLEAQRSLLGAADALERRASALREWPIDEGTSARVITITTSVIAMAIGRMILSPLGL
jgi:hypothetical protein